MEKKKRLLTPEERRQRNHDEMVANILQASREVMREQGVADLNLQEIARRVGMRAPSLYNYFSNRNAIYDALFTLGMQMYQAHLAQLLAQYGTTWEGIERIIEGYLTYALENPELYQLLFERPVPGYEPSADALAESRKLLATAYEMVAAAMATGTIQTTQSAEVVTNMIIVIMHGIAAQHLANEPHLPVGKGRFGSLVPIAVDILKKAWS